MKELELRKTKVGDVYHYEVIEHNKVIALRKSHREYIACYVEKYNFDNGSTSFYLPYFFGRTDLIGKGSSKNFEVSANAYAIAKIKS